MPTGLSLYALGSNGAGQLGIGNQDDVSVPQQCIFDSPATLSNNGNDNDKPIIGIRAGGNHTLLLTANGRAWGSGNRNALPASTASTHVLSTFHQLDIVKLCNIPSSSKVTHVAAGWETSYFVVDRQVVYACGIGVKGELGLGEEVPDCSIPNIALDLRGQNLGDVASISSGMSHVVVVTDTGEAFGWGTSRKGELGQGLMNERVVWKPRRLQVGFPALGVVAGRNFTFFQGDEGKQAFFGNSKTDPSVSEEATLLKQSTHCQVFAGWSSLYVLDPSGRLDSRAFGGSRRAQVPTNKLPRLAHFAAGSEHGLAVTAEDGRVIAFGWGEHGNCGQPVDSRGDVSGDYNTIPIALGPGETIYDVGAGCATSFIAVSYSLDRPVCSVKKPLDL